MFRRQVLARVGIVAAALALAGCAGSYVAHPAPARTGSRMASATIEWAADASTAIPVRLHKGAAAMGYVPPKPSIDNRDQVQGLARARAVLATYREHAAPMLRKLLAAEGVTQGAQTRIVLRPTAMSIDANNGAVSIAVQVTVTLAGAPGAWTVSVVSNNMADGAYWNVLRPVGIGDTVDVDLTKLVDSFAHGTATQMRLAGWFVG